MPIHESWHRQFTPERGGGIWEGFCTVNAQQIGPNGWEWREGFILDTSGNQTTVWGLVGSFYLYRFDDFVALYKIDPHDLFG